MNKLQLTGLLSIINSEKDMSMSFCADYSAHELYSNKFCVKIVADEEDFIVIDKIFDKTVTVKYDPEMHESFISDLVSAVKNVSMLSRIKPELLKEIDEYPDICFLYDGEIYNDISLLLVNAEASFDGQFDFETIVPCDTIRSDYIVDINNGIHCSNDCIEYSFLTHWTNVFID